MSKKKILIVEDSSYIAESLADIFILKNHKPKIALCGHDALTLVKKTKPDLILLNIILPDLDGYEVYQRLRQDKWGAKANIIILTASETVENISKNIDIPHHKIIFKPDHSVTDLLEKIDLFLLD